MWICQNISLISTAVPPHKVGFLMCCNLAIIIIIKQGLVTIIGHNVTKMPNKWEITKIVGFLLKFAGLHLLCQDIVTPPSKK